MGLLGLQYPPMIIGMKNHVRLLKSWYVWKIVVTAKRTVNMAAAARDGLYA